MPLIFVFLFDLENRNIDYYFAKLCNPILSPTFLNADCSSSRADEWLQYYYMIGESTLNIFGVFSCILAQVSINWP